MTIINHAPCLTDDTIILRMMEDQHEIDKMIKEGYHVRAVVSYHSDVTFETHSLPIFAEDTLQDILNRYYDFFPKECLQTMRACEELSKTLYSSDGLSKAKSILSSFKIPLGLWKLLESWRTDFFAVVPGQNEFVNKGLIKQFLDYMPRFRIEAPYGKRTFAVS
jgi:hypothetical protein